MSPYEERNLSKFQSGGFELYLPPTPFSMPPEPARLVMVDDLRQVIYDVDYETSFLKNTIPWSALNLHKIEDPAIVFRPMQLECLMLPERAFATGLLASIETRDDGVYKAKRVGVVNVSPFPKEVINWAVLQSWNGEELPTEMQAGPLRRVWNRRQQAT